MKDKYRSAPPFSPVLLAGLALRPLPPAALQPWLRSAIGLVARRHPGVFERLSSLQDPVYLIDPVDLPFALVLRPDAEAPSLVALSEAEAETVEATATIRGPMMKLVELLEGRTDGDALFFTRELVVEGDTEAVVALRNAIDGAEINMVEDILSALGPLSRPARAVLSVGSSLFARASRDMEMLRRALIAPAMRRSEAQASELRELEETIAELRRQARRTRTSRA